MIALLILTMIIVGLGVAAALDRVPDTRDPEFQLGRLLDAWDRPAR